MNETESASVASGGSRSALIVGIVVLLVLGAGAIIYFAMRQTAVGPPATPIAEILNDLRRYDGQFVTVEGTVSGTINIMLVKAYDVTDDTGTIKVVTERGLPREGEEVNVSGQVREVFRLTGVNYTVIYEAVEEEN